MPKNIELSLKELKVEAVKLGMPKSDVESFTTRKQMKAVLNTLKAAKTVQKVDKLEKPGEVDSKEDRDSYVNKAENMRKKWESEEKIRTKIPLEDGETIGVVKRVKIRGRWETEYVSGTVLTPQANGCKWLVPKGVLVEIPKSVLKLIEDGDEDVAKAGEQFAIKRTKKDERTGEVTKVEDVLQ